MPYFIRCVTPEDLDAVTAVETACFPPAEAATRESFRTRISTFPTSFFVAEENHQIIGIINGCCTTAPYLGDDLYEPNCPHRDDHPWQTVLGLGVLPGFQHRGVAGALIRHLITCSEQRGKKGIILTCKQEKIGFYESFGFACRGLSDSVHGGAKWYDMILRL